MWSEVDSLEQEGPLVMALHHSSRRTGGMLVEHGTVSYRMDVIMDGGICIQKWALMVAADDVSVGMMMKKRPKESPSTSTEVYQQNVLKYQK